MSSPLVTIDSGSSVEVAANIMAQVDMCNKPLGIITPSNFVGYLKENLNMDDVNAKILESLKEQREEGP